MSEKDKALFWANIYEKKRRQEDGSLTLHDIDAMIAKALRLYATSLSE